MIKRESTKNKLSFLLLPMLGGNWNDYGFSGNSFINCYYKFKGKEEEFDNCIFLLYKYPDLKEDDGEELEKILKLEENLKKDLNGNKFLQCLDVNEEHIVLIYKINERYLTEYNTLLQSKYSYLSPKYKEEIIKFHNPINIPGITKVLNRDKEMLANIHKDLGCKKSKADCNCKASNYMICNHFVNFEFDFDKQEVWGQLDDKEVLSKDKFKIKENVQTKNI